jgi:uncharacterized membrane protein
MAGHSHAPHEYDVEVGRVARTLLLSVLALAAIATVAGVWRLWPDAAHQPTTPAAAAYAAPGVTFPHAKVTAVQPACPVVRQDGVDSGADLGYRPSPTCGNVAVRLSGDDGPRTVSVQLPPEAAHSGLRAGDTVQLARTPASHGQPASYSYFGTDRHVPLFWFTVLFAVVVIAVARWRGLMALVTLAFGAFVITKFMLPALLDGEAGIWVALVGSSAIMFVVLYCTHGPSLRTSAALAGTLLGIGITAVLGHYGIHTSRLTGIADESGGMLAGFVSNLSFTGLLTCGLIVASLGVLNDVTITQSSAVWELRAAAPDLPRRQVFTSAMRIGRDHIASTIYTIVFAYAGASIVVLLLLVIYDRPLLDLISSEDIAEEIVRTLTSAIGLVLAVPITTAIAAAAASPAPQRTTRGWEPLVDDRDPFERFWKSNRA